MLVFVILLLAPMLIQHVVLGRTGVDPKKKNKAALVCFFVLLTLLVALRHESVGSDTRNYRHFFETFAAMDWAAVGRHPLEAGFSYFNKLVSVFSDSPQIFLVVTAVLTALMIYPTYKRLCCDTTLTVLLFCTMSTFVMLFSGIRQMLALGIGMLAYEAVRKKKPFFFLLAVLVAISFHTSAFMLLPMYLLYHTRITKKWLFFVVPALACIFAFNRPIFSVLAKILERYTDYDATITETGAYTMVLLFALFVAFAFLIPDERQLDSETIGLRNFLLLSLVLQMFAPLHMIAMRMNYYYIIFIPLLIPRVIRARSERWAQVALAGRHLMVVFFLAYFFISAGGSGALHVFPYHFFWEAGL